MEVYGKECMSRTRVFEWHKRFHEGRTIGVARIFDWGGPNHKSHAMTSSEIFEKVIFCGAKIS